MKISNTIQRKIIVEELRKLKNHPSAEELYEIVRQRLPRISLGTVYRNLELLSQNGIIAKLEVTGREKRFDGNAVPHYHLRCLHCNAIEDVEFEEIKRIEHELNSKLNGRIRAVKIEFSGLCRNCADKEHLALLPV